MNDQFVLTKGMLNVVVDLKDFISTVLMKIETKYFLLCYTQMFSAANCHFKNI